MKFWKWFGWDTKDARTERNYDNNTNKTARWMSGCLAAVLIALIIWG
jgi:hypothetical protein